MEGIRIGGLQIRVERKKIKNVHLSVYPPKGRVRIAAPETMTLATIRYFAINKLPWIREQQRQLSAQERESPREFLDRETHYLWGRRRMLELVETHASPRIEARRDKLILHKLSGWDADRCQQLLEEWYRLELRSAATPIISRWEERMGVRVNKLFIQRMKTQWGSCTPERRSIRLNTELAKKPGDCLEYLIVHEMTHFFERTHNDRFVSKMDQYLPNWRALREKLNRLPVRHESWSY